MKCSLYPVVRSLTPLQGCALDVKQFRQPVRFCCTYSQEKPSDAEKNRQPNGTVKIKGVLPV